MTVHPDVILLILDTQRLDRLSCYEHSLETTPYLDELAADATLFRRAYATAQWTVPSHASMFTGLYPAQHTMLHASSVLPDNLTPLAERLNRDGYFTAAFCNNPLIGIVNTGLQRGFHSFLNYGGLMTSRPHQTGGEKHVFDRYRQRFKRGLANVLNTMQDVFAHSDSLLDLSFSPLIAPLWQTALSFKGNTAKSLQDAAKLHIERKGLEKDQPVFSFVNLMGAHMPYHPPPHFVERFAPRVSRDKEARRFLRQFNSDVFGWMAPLASSINEKNKAILDGMYNAEVAHQDELLGAFFKQLRASGALDHTLLIICADHGEHLGEKQLMGHSVSLYDTLVHVPLIVRDPSGDFPRGISVDRMVSTRRIFHTALTAAGSGTTAEESLTLAQCLNSDPEPIFALGVTPQNLLNLMQRRRPDLIQARHWDLPRRAVWHEHYKLIQTGDDELELYDIVDDPQENVDLQHVLPEKVEKLRTYLLNFARQMNADDVLDVNLPEVVAADALSDPRVYRRLHDLGYLE